MAFPTTRWTLLAEATLHGDAAGREALARLCEKYRRLVVVYLATHGLAAGEAEDLAQDFFLKLLGSRLWKRADRQRGRFRTFLLTVLHNLLLHAHRNQRRQKRGGGLEIDSLDALLDGDQEINDDAIADAQTFDREWAHTLVADTVTALDLEYAGRGQSAEFALLRRFLPGPEQPPTYEDAAAALKLSLTALKAAVHRLRQRFRELLRTAVARTVSAPHEVDEELRYLGTLLMQGGASVPAAPQVVGRLGLVGRLGETASPQASGTDALQPDALQTTVLPPEESRNSAPPTGNI